MAFYNKLLHFPVSSIPARETYIAGRDNMVEAKMTGMTLLVFTFKGI